METRHWKTTVILPFSPESDGTSCLPVSAEGLVLLPPRSASSLSPTGRTRPPTHLCIPSSSVPRRVSYTQFPNLWAGNLMALTWVFGDPGTMRPGGLLLHHQGLLEASPCRGEGRPHRGRGKGNSDWCRTPWQTLVVRRDVDLHGFGLHVISWTLKAAFHMIPSHG